MSALYKSPAVQLEGSVIFCAQRNSNIDQLMHFKAAQPAVCEANVETCVRLEHLKIKMKIRSGDCGDIHIRGKHI